jgi:hypothetical protein
VSELQKALVMIAFGIVLLATPVAERVIRNALQSKLSFAKPDGEYAEANIALWRLIGLGACFVGGALLLKAVLK